MERALLISNQTNVNPLIVIAIFAIIGILCTLPLKVSFFSNNSLTYGALDADDVWNYIYVNSLWKLANEMSHLYNILNNLIIFDFSNSVLLAQDIQRVSNNIIHISVLFNEQYPQFNVLYDNLITGYKYQIVPLIKFLTVHPLNRIETIELKEQI